MSDSGVFLLLLTASGEYLISRAHGLHGLHGSLHHVSSVGGTQGLGDDVGHTSGLKHGTYLGYKENGPGEITITEHFSGNVRSVDVEEAAGGYAGHGGGDWGLVSNLYNDMRLVEDSSLMTTPIQASAHSHVIAFAVEHARRTGEVIDIADFERKVLSGELNY